MIVSFTPAILARIFICSLALILSLHVAYADEVSNYVKDGAVIGGVDPVGYFVEMRPVPGDPLYAIEWNGATWRFSSAGNRDAFVANPAMFAPQYGGFCALAMSYGKKLPINPEAFKIVDGKLYLNASKEAQTEFEKDELGTIARANAQWKNVEHIAADKL